MSRLTVMARAWTLPIMGEIMRMRKGAGPSVAPGSPFVLRLEWAPGSR